MNLFDRIKRRFSRQSAPMAPHIRTLPEPTRVNLAEREVHGGHFDHLPEWSTYTPAPPAWQLADIEEQSLWIDRLVAAHAERGGLDGLVPDLLDRLIHHRVDGTRQTIEDAHTQAKVVSRNLWEQAKQAQVEAASELFDLRQRLADAEEGYLAAYTVLTGAPPKRQPIVLDLAPVCITTQVAPTEVLAEPEAPTPGDPSDGDRSDTDPETDLPPLQLAR